MTTWVTLRELKAELGHHGSIRRLVETGRMPRQRAAVPVRAVGGSCGGGHPSTYEYPLEECRRVLSRYLQDPKARASRGDRGRFAWIPTDTALWSWRGMSIESIASQIRIPRETLRRYLVARGWRWKTHRGVVIAPCVGCGRPTPVAELNPLRECRSC